MKSLIKYLVIVGLLIVTVCDIDGLSLFWKVEISIWGAIFIGFIFLPDSWFPAPKPKHRRKSGLYRSDSDTGAHGLPWMSVKARNARRERRNRHYE